MIYSNGQSSVKDMVRKFVVRQALNHLRRCSLNIFSLPADNFFFEEMLAEACQEETHFTMVEADKKVYNKGSKKVKGFQGIYHNMTTTECLLKDSSLRGDKTFDIVWLDYCGQYTTKVRKDLELLSKRIHEDSIVFITLLGNRDNRNHYKPIMNKLGLCKDTLWNIRTKAIPADMSDFLSLPLASITGYRDNTIKSKASPMLLYELRRTKETFFYDLTYTKRKL